MDIQVERGMADGYACGLLLLFSFDKLGILVHQDYSIFLEILVRRKALYGNEVPPLGAVPLVITPITEGALFGQEMPVCLDLLDKIQGFPTSLLQLF